MRKQKLNLTINPNIRRKANAMAHDDHRSVSSFIECLVALEWSRRMRGDNIDASRCPDCDYITQRDEKGRCENCGFRYGDHDKVRICKECGTRDTFEVINGLGWRCYCGNLTRMLIPAPSFGAPAKVGRTIKGKLGNGKSA